MLIGMGIRHGLHQTAFTYSALMDFPCLHPRGSTRLAGYLMSPTPVLGHSNILTVGISTSVGHTGLLLRCQNCFLILNLSKGWVLLNLC